LDAADRPLRLAFAGTPPFAVPALDALRASRHTVQGVFTQTDRPAGRGRELQASAVKRRALELGLPVWQPQSLRTPEAVEQLRALDLDAFVVVAYGLILPAELLALPRFGCLNIHASLLPRWRGAAPVQRAILAGDAETGVTIMRMDAGLDTGPMLDRRVVPIGPRQTAQTLQDQLAVLGAEMIQGALDRLAAGAAGAVPQPQAGVTYAAKITKAEALIDWRDDAAGVDRKVRAFMPRPIAETRLRGEQLRIWEAELPAAADVTGPADSLTPGTIVGATRAGIDVACGRGVLRLTRVQAAGRKPVDAHQFAATQSLVGVCLASP
jgi:methionyl-tRNA formyltransferase